MKVQTRLIMCLMLFLSACQEDKRSVDEDIIYFRLSNLENAGWKSQSVIQHIDGIDFQATEVPIQYYLLKEMGKTNLKAIDSVYELNKHERILELTFKHIDKKDLLKEDFTNMDYSSSVRYMSFNIQNDFYVVTNKNDTVPCVGVNFERTFKVDSSNKILLFFNDVDPNQDLQLVYNDQLFDRGLIKFQFTKPIIKLDYVSANQIE